MPDRRTRVAPHARRRLQRRTVGLVLILLPAAGAPGPAGLGMPGAPGLRAQAPDAPAHPAAPPAPYAVPRLDGPIRWDRAPTAPDWDGIPPLPAVQSAPRYGAPPSERTEFRLAHDEVYLYAAARMYDAEPDGIRALSLRRDEASFSNDWFLVSLDTFRDRQNTLLFATTPTGLRTDAAFANDGAPPANLAWHTFWDAAVTRDGDGWYAVIRIPFSSLRFEERDGQVLMGVTLARRIARKNEMVSWPGIPHDWGVFSIYKASLMQEIVLQGVRPATPVYATPYVAAGAARTHALDADRTGYVRHGESLYEPGLDLKYSPATNVAVDVTVNPDFAQVEADEQRVNLTRFSLFFPERRPFFQDRAAVFEVPLGGNDRIFHSRRMGLVNGAPARIHAGARMVAHAAGWDLGLMTMQTEAGAGASSENAGVLRVQRQVLNPQSTAGAIVTSRLGGDGTRHLTLGGDAILRVIGQDFLTLNWAGSLDRADPGETRPDPSFYRLRWERRGIYGLTYLAEAARVGPGFAPGLGYVARTGYDRARLDLAFGRRAGAASPLLGHSIGIHGSVHRRIGGAVESAAAGPSWRVETKTGHAFGTEVIRRYEDLERPFAVGPDAHVPAGDHTFTELRLQYSPARTTLQIPVSVTAGGFYDGRRFSVGASPLWNPSPHLQLSGAYQFNRIRFARRDQRFESHITRLRALVMVDTRISATGFVQYSSSDDLVGVNLRLRYNPREGTDLYLVYDHSLNTDRFAYDPAPPRTASRTLLLKFARTFTLLGGRP
jgi:hypothetical protein